MGLPPQRIIDQQIYPISEKDAAMERIPQFLPFESAAPIAAGTTAQVDQIVSWNDFIVTKMGFTSPTVGFPAGPGRWKVQIQDIGASRQWQPEGFDVTAAVGANSGLSDSAPVDLPVPWVFLEKTTIRVTFEELTGFANTPHLLLIGYLTNWKREAAAAQAIQQMEIQVLKSQMQRTRL